MQKWIMNGSVTSTWMSKKILKKIPAIRGKAEYLNCYDHSVDFDDYSGAYVYFGDSMYNSMNRSEARNKGIHDKLITYYQRYYFDGFE